MSNPLIVTQSSRGQIALPVSIRSEMKLEEGTKFAVYASDGFIVLKPIRLPEERDFKEVMAKAKVAAQESGLNASDIDDAIKEVRRKKRETQ
jgi:AbrB family looped-hinge helix DNA binding protein